MEKIDIIGRINGSFGRWQLRTIFLIFLCKIPSAWFMACIIFTAPEPRRGEYFCAPSQNVLNANTSEKWQQLIRNTDNKAEWIRFTHPIKSERLTIDEDEIDFCNVFADANIYGERYFHAISNSRPFQMSEHNNSIVPCERFIHHSEYQSIITDYNLVCSRDILVATTQFFHLFGVLTGGLLAVNLLKYCSPKSVMLFGMISQIFCGNMTGLVQTYELHVFFRCLSAVACCQMYTAGQMIFTDITDGKPKIMAITLFETFWSVGVILLPSLASFFDSWSYLYMAISYPTLILIVLLYWIPNSPRWLILHNRISEARDVLVQSAQINNRTHLIPNDLSYLLHLQSQNVRSEPPPANWWSIWRGKNAVRHMICVHLAWAIYIIVYYGMLLNIRAFSRDHLEINTMIAGCCEIIGVLIGLTMILFTKKKWFFTGLFNVFGGFCAYSAWFIPPEITGDLRIALLMLSSMILKTAISSTLAILTTCTTELVNSESKKICAFSTIVWARINLLMAPFIGATIVFGQLIPQTSFSTLAIIGGLLCMMINGPRTLPQEKHLNLPKKLKSDIFTINK